ncbi:MULTISPECIES: hypothetical protein [Rhizobium/Agrobacterium group]|uniref:hypothetical protein n=1 Tax=Rhizobium/Agrobacterium group TaxID=227290 RepID=UPI0018D207E1|nr:MULTISPECIES: hypothetical protein [Rhizobium/Agrobacterium group]
MSDDSRRASSRRLFAKHKRSTGTGSINRNASGHSDNSGISSEMSECNCSITVEAAYFAFDAATIILRTNGIRGLKNVQSKRLLPVPEELVRLGFIDYVQAIKQLGYEALFPDLFSDKTDNDPGDRFYDTFVPIMQGALGENMWDRAIHALRHGMADTLKQAGVPT